MTLQSDLYLTMQKTSLALLAIIAISLTLFYAKPSTPQSSDQLKAFNQWKSQFSKVYQSESQQKYRFKIFLKNYLMVNTHNKRFEAGQEMHNMRLNQFSDLTIEEFTKTYLTESPAQSNAYQCTGPQYPKKDSFDKNFTTESKMLISDVGEQGQCKSGYAFATVAAVESSMYKIFKQIQAMSAQQVVDCSQQTQNNGCDGGNPANAMHYLMNRGAMKNSDYPYTGKNQPCVYDSARKIWQVQNCTKVASDLVMLKSSIFNQPVIVGFDASDLKFIQYGSDGIYTGDGCKTNINHYMLAIGWGQVTKTVATVDITNYYIVAKNSFGKKWGADGLVKILVAVKEGKLSPKEKDACGLLKEIYYPYG